MTEAGALMTPELVRRLTHWHGESIQFLRGSDFGDGTWLMVFVSPLIQPNRPWLKEVSIHEGRVRIKAECDV